ncbi:MAG: hydroxyacid dehydrogenase [Acutalibacteraceae bacterium]|jgi:phosphoglycerate dehydrogenase-like enzyme
MKTVFMSNQKDRFHNVFKPDVIDYLVKIAGSDGKCYSRDEVIQNKDKFTDTEFIFSTWGMANFSEEEIAEIFPALKCVFYAAGSVQYFARPFLNSGVKVFSAWAANAVPVAEYTVSQIILANSGFFKCSVINSREDYKKAKEEFKKYRGNYGAEIGLLGAGMIGKLVINMLKAYELKVLVFDPFLPDDKASELGVEKTSLKEIFSRCEVVSNHLANNEQTRHILNRELFESMKPYATFLNTGRGAQVVEQDLISVLKKRPDLTAILDVTDPEPPLDDSELYLLPNCILTPHIAGSSGDEVQRMAKYMLEEFKSYTQNLPTKYEVTLKMLETMA